MSCETSRTGSRRRETITCLRSRLSPYRVLAICKRTPSGRRVLFVRARSCNGLRWRRSTSWQAIWLLVGRPRRWRTSLPKSQCTQLTSSNVSDPRALAIILEKAEENLRKNQHPDPYHRESTARLRGSPVVLVGTRATGLQLSSRRSFLWPVADGQPPCSPTAPSGSATSLPGCSPRRRRTTRNTIRQCKINRCMRRQTPTHKAIPFR